VSGICLACHHSTRNDIRFLFSELKQKYQILWDLDTHRLFRINLLLCSWPKKSKEIIYLKWNKLNFFIVNELTSMLKSNFVRSSKLTETINLGWLLIWFVVKVDDAFWWLDALLTSIKLILCEHLLHLTSNILLKYF